mgnify:CR=1 FL=1
MQQTIKNFETATALPKGRIVAYSATEKQVALAVSPASSIAGVTDQSSTLAGRVDVQQAGQVLVEFGGDVLPGEPLMADDEGRAVVFDAAVALPDAGDVAWIVGVAEEEGVEGSQGYIRLSPQMLIK